MFRVDSAVLDLGVTAPGAAFTEYGTSTPINDIDGVCATKTIVSQYGTFLTAGDSISFAAPNYAFRFVGGARSGTNLTTNGRPGLTPTVYSFIKE
jgi:hypothetical protein